MEGGGGTILRLIAEKDLLRWLHAEQAHIAERRAALATRAVRIAALRLKERNEARTALANAGRELESFVEASLEECDYTSDGESMSWEPDEYERAKANIREMHRVLLVRLQRLFQAQDEIKRLEAVERELVQLRAGLASALGIRVTSNAVMLKHVQSLRSDSLMDAIDLLWPDLADEGTTSRDGA